MLRLLQVNSWSSCQHIIQCLVWHDKRAVVGWFAHGLPPCPAHYPTILTFQLDSFSIWERLAPWAHRKSAESFFQQTICKQSWSRLDTLEYHSSCNWLFKSNSKYTARIRTRNTKIHWSFISTKEVPSLLQQCTSHHYHPCGAVPNLMILDRKSKHPHHKPSFAEKMRHVKFRPLNSHTYCTWILYIYNIYIYIYTYIAAMLSQPKKRNTFPSVLRFG